MTTVKLDGFGNKLDIDPQGVPILHSDGTQFTLAEEDDPSLSNPKFGSWCKQVHENDVLLIDNVTFRVLSRAEFIYDTKEETSVDKKETNEEDEDEDDEDDEEEKEEIDENDLDYRDTKHKLQDLMIMDRKYSDDHICLDRPWMLDDAEYLPVSKVVPQIFYMKPFSAAANTVIKSYLPQKAIQITAINTNNAARLSDYLSALFDSESDMCIRLKEYSGKLKAQRDDILRLSRQVVDMSYDFTLRRRIWKSIKSKTESFVKYLRLLKQRVASAAGDENAGLDFETWEASENKVPVSIFLETDNAPDERLGEIHVDLSAPVYIMRLHLYRDESIRTRLNELQGPHFQFFVVKENEDYDDENPAANAPGVESVIDWLLERDKEKMTYAHDFAPFKMDNKTMEGGNRCSIVLDKEHTEYERCPKLDKRGREIEEIIEEGVNEGGSVQGSIQGSVQGSLGGNAA